MYLSDSNLTRIVSKNLLVLVVFFLYLLFFGATMLVVSLQTVSYEVAERGQKRLKYKDLKKDWLHKLLENFTVLKFQLMVAICFKILKNMLEVYFGYRMFTSMLQVCF